jgi:integrase
MLSAMGRSADGSGHLRKRRDGLYEVRVRRDGKRISYYGQTQGEALRKAEAPKPSRETVHGFLTDWLEKRRGTIRASTWRRYETTVRNSLLPHLPNIRLGALTTSHVEHLNEETLGSASLARKARVVLGTALQYAVDTHRIPANPCHSRVLRLTVTSRDWVILDKDDTRKLLAAAKILPRYEALYVLAVTTGMRVGEICAVRWQDIDLDRGTLKVTGTINRDESNRLARLTPKTDRAKRTIGLSDIAIEALRRTPRDEGDALVGYEDLVFRGNADFLDPSTVTRHHFPDVLRAAGLAHMVMHDLRHTAITHMLESNIMPHTVSEIVGHSSPAFTLARYASVTRGMHDSAVEATNRRYS